MINRGSQRTFDPALPNFLHQKINSVCKRLHKPLAACRFQATGTQSVAFRLGPRLCEVSLVFLCETPSFKSSG